MARNAEGQNSDKDETTSSPQWPTPALDDQNLRMSYNIARGEQGVLTFEPYKSILLPHWRFRTVPIAKTSSKTLWAAFGFYLKARDFVGADMARKFVRSPSLLFKATVTQYDSHGQIQMGMTRAKRYANHAGGRKYDRTARQVEAEGGTRTELPRSTGHKGQEEKLAASEVFKEVWTRCTSDERYLALRDEWKEERKAWDKVKKEDGGNVKAEKDEEDHIKVKSEDNGD